MWKYWAILVLCGVGLMGCGRGMAGTYQAQVKQIAPPKGKVDVGYSLQEVRQQLAAEPRVIELRSNGRFETRNGQSVVWEGTWRREGDALFLNAQTVNGIRVIKALQKEKRFEIVNDAIIDDGVYGYYGLRLIYRKP